MYIERAPKNSSRENNRAIKPRANSRKKAEPFPCARRVREEDIPRKKTAPAAAERKREREDVLGEYASGE